MNAVEADPCTHFLGIGGETGNEQKSRVKSAVLLGNLKNEPPEGGNGGYPFGTVILIKCKIGQP